MTRESVNAPKKEKQQILWNFKGEGVFREKEEKTDLEATNTDKTAKHPPLEPMLYMVCERKKTTVATWKFSQEKQCSQELGFS